MESIYEKKVAQLIEANKGPMNLEIGSGFGKWSQLFSPDKYIGIEIDSRAARFAHREFHSEIIIADTRALPLRRGVFDFVFSCGVVEHFPEHSRAIQEHVRVSNSRILISVPNLFSPFILASILRSIRRRYNGRQYQMEFGTRFTESGFLRMANLESFSMSKLGISLPGPIESIFKNLDSILGNELFFLFKK